MIKYNSDKRIIKFDEIILNKFLIDIKKTNDQRLGKIYFKIFLGIAKNENFQRNFLFFQYILKNLKNMKIGI